MLPLRPWRFALVVAALASLAHGAQAAAPRRTVESYVLLATEVLRADGLHVTSGDLGVDHGLLAAAGPIDAPSSQLVADTVRIGRGTTCAGLLSGRTLGTAAACPLAGSFAGPLIGDVARACGYPTPFPACDPRRKVSVGHGETAALASGVYGDLIVGGGDAGAGILDLAGGHYVFCHLRLGRGAELRFQGPSQIEVVGDVQLGRDTVLGPAAGVALAANDVRLVAAGRNLHLARGSQVTARLCAPDSRLSLRGTLHGNAVARRIRTLDATAAAPYAEAREPCAAHDPLRHAWFGDLHVHTTLSFDAHAYDVPTTEPQAYRFAKGEPVLLPPLDATGAGTQMLQIDRPLDFAAATDHSEFLGEVEACSVPGSPGYDSPSCQAYRLGGNDAVTLFGVRLPLGARLDDICGADGQSCLTLASQVWQRVQDAAEQAYDRSAECTFTSFVAYEYSATEQVSTLHRNVVFRNERVPFPISFFEQPTREGLWAALRAGCIDAGTGCDVLAIPHNSNESNGRMFLTEYPGATTIDDERAQAAFRGSIEPLIEVYQHKGDSECANGLSGIVGAPDEQCDFEKRRRPGFRDCGDGIGAFGTITAGCVSRRDFVRGALLEGLLEEERLGKNPMQLGMIASTDTHNGTPGAVGEDRFIGHRGTDDDTPAKQLGPGDLYPGGIIFSPGGLAGVWAEENSRPSLFDALRRRETFGTSGPRIAVRFFGGFGLAAGLCADPEMVRKAYAAGVPMGGTLGTAAGAPSFLVSALRDPGTAARPGTQLQRVQIVKGWIEGGERHEQVYDVAGDAQNGATVDDATCAPSGPGADALCTVWTDPAFAPGVRAFYYTRVLENPSCRWSTYTCNALPPAARPPSCTDPAVPRTIQERAWTSPIWYRPPAG